MPKPSSTPPRLSSRPLPAEYPCPGSLIILVPASRSICPRLSHVPKLASTWLLAPSSRSYPLPRRLGPGNPQKLYSPPQRSKVSLTRLPAESILAPDANQGYRLPRFPLKLPSPPFPAEAILSPATRRCSPRVPAEAVLARIPPKTILSCRHPRLLMTIKW